MSLLTIKPETQQKLAVFVPIIALGVSLFVVWPAWGRYSDLNQSIDRNRRELADLKATPPPPKLLAGKPTETDTVSEPSEFLGMLKRLATASGCELTTADVTPREAAKGESGPVRAVPSKLEIVGEYRQIRSFLWQLEHAGRLLAVADIALSPAVPQAATPGSGAGPSSGGVRASITVERYLSSKRSDKS